jgi:hypothetical protein
MPSHSVQANFDDPGQFSIGGEEFDLVHSKKPGKTPVSRLKKYC